MTITLNIEIVSSSGRDKWTLGYALGWTAHEEGRTRARRCHPHAREKSAEWERDWLAGWDARHKATLRAAQDEGMNG